MPRTVEIDVGCISKDQIRLLGFNCARKLEITVEDAIIDLNVVANCAVLMKDLDVESVVIWVRLASLVKIKQNERCVGESSWREVVVLASLEWMGSLVNFL